MIRKANPCDGNNASWLHPIGYAFSDFSAKCFCCDGARWVLSVLCTASVAMILGAGRQLTMRESLVFFAAVIAGALVLGAFLFAVASEFNDYRRGTGNFAPAQDGNDAFSDRARRAVGIVQELTGQSVFLPLNEMLIMEAELARDLGFATLRLDADALARYALAESEFELSDAEVELITKLRSDAIEEFYSSKGAYLMTLLDAAQSRGA